MAVGFIRASPSDIVGNSRGNPPACHTPRFTASATRRKCALQFVSSLQLFEMPMTGRPRKTSSVNPSVLTHARCRKPSTSRRRSEEHTSELQSLRHLVCRLLLEKKNESE